MLYTYSFKSFHWISTLNFYTLVAQNYSLFQNWWLRISVYWLTLCLSEYSRLFFLCFLLLVYLHLLSLEKRTLAHLLQKPSRPVLCCFTVFKWSKNRWALKRSKNSWRLRSVSTTRKQFPRICVPIFWFFLFGCMTTLVLFRIFEICVNEMWLQLSNVCSLQCEHVRERHMREDVSKRWASFYEVNGFSICYESALCSARSAILHLRRKTSNDASMPSRTCTHFAVFDHFAVFHLSLYCTKLKELTHSYIRTKLLNFFTRIWQIIIVKLLIRWGWAWNSALVPPTVFDLDHLKTFQVV